MIRGRMALFGFLLTVLVLAAMPACAMKHADLKGYAADRSAHVDGEKFFGYRRAPIEANESVVEEKCRYNIVRVSFPSYFQGDPANNRTVALDFRQKSKEPSPSIIVLPILGGPYDVTLMFAEFFADRGFNVLHFERKSGIFEAADRGLKYVRQMLIASIIDVRRGIDWWLTQPEVDASRLGVLGVSMGGFQSSLLMAVDDRIKAGVFLLSGGDFPDLLFASKEPSVIEYIDDLKKKTGMTEDELRQDARAQLSEIDPLVFAPNIDPARVMMITGRFDEVVPPDFSDRWWEAAHRPNRAVIPTGHYSAIFALHYALRTSVDHFNDVFGMGN